MLYLSNKIRFPRSLIKNIYKCLKKFLCKILITDKLYVRLSYRVCMCVIRYLLLHMNLHLHGHAFARVMILGDKAIVTNVDVVLMIDRE